jgi:hypothetical protein
LEKPAVASVLPLCHFIANISIYKSPKFSLQRHPTVFFIGFFPLNKKTPRLNGLALLEPTRAE